MTAPLISANSTWQHNYDNDKAKLSKSDQNTANNVTDSAAAAVNAGTPAQRNAALTNAHNALDSLTDAVGANNSAVKELTALVNVAQFEHDAANGVHGQQLEHEADDAISALQPIDRTAAATFANVAFGNLGGHTTDEGNAFASHHQDLKDAGFTATPATSTTSGASPTMQGREHVDPGTGPVAGA